MSYRGNLLNGTLQEIINQQSILDKRVVKDHDLFDDEGNKNLMANFDENRLEAITVSYLYLRTAARALRAAGTKWWKIQKPMTAENAAKFKEELAGGEYFDLETEISNTSMKISAITQELIELEDAINEGKPIEDIHEEFIDVIHFVISLGLDLGITSEQQVRELYERKNKINHTRQNESY